MSQKVWFCEPTERSWGCERSDQFDLQINPPFFKKKQWRRRRCALTGFQEQRDVKSGQKFLLQGQTKHQTNFPSVVLNESTHLSTWHQCIPERLTKLWSDFLTHCYADSTLILLSQVLMDLEVGPAQLPAGPWCHFTLVFYQNLLELEMYSTWNQFNNWIIFGFI